MKPKRINLLYIKKFDIAKSIFKIRKILWRTVGIGHFPTFPEVLGDERTG
jgi:hypothetical protein